MAVNASLVPSPMDLLMVFPRLAQKAGLFAMQLPEMIKGSGSIIAEATATNMTTAVLTSSSSAAAFVQETAAAIASDGADSGMFSWLMPVLDFEGVRGLGGMFSYFSSRWALATFTVVWLSALPHGPSLTILWCSPYA
jgi:hypothetical protein